MKEFFENVMAELDASVEGFSWTDRASYANYLAQTYYYVRHSTRLLACAAGRFSEKQEPLFRRFATHMNEERGHDKLALNNLAALGFSVDDFPETPETRMLYETQYFKIEHLDPAALLGYILVLEAVAIRQIPGAYKKAQAAFGPKSTTFLKVHVEEDPDHLTKAFETLQAFTPRQIEWVKENVTQTAKAFSLFLAAAGSVQLRNAKAA